MNNKFNWQSFISIGLLLSFIVMLISGIVLYIAPEGSLSRWIGWDILNLSKKQWEHQHTIFSYLFILFSIFHVFKINWSYLISYFVFEKFKMINLKEIIVAVVITVLIFMGTLLNWSPFKNVIQFGSNISDSYAEKVEIPNIPDAEKLSLKDFSEKVSKVSYEEVYNKLINIDFKSIDENIIVSEFCKINKIAPQELYKILKGELSISGSAEITDSPNITLYNSYFGDKKAIL
ncbi:MAG: DUF4405 domain-containing protein [Bacteroidales bacterium]|nr:DUF4405 domain-containing protein [Bacteroidales bacterium]